VLYKIGFKKKKKKKKTDTAQCNWISLVLMEALQMLKHTFNNSSMDLTADLLTPEAKLVVDTNMNLLANLMSVSGDVM
jgi:hypothetical protein